MRRAVSFDHFCFNLTDVLAAMLVCEYKQCVPKVQPTKCYISRLAISIKRSTCFRRLLHPTSGAQTVHTASGIFQTLLLSAAADSQKLYIQFELLMIGGGTA
jgi:hypothetical protein